MDGQPHRVPVEAVQAADDAVGVAPVYQNGTRHAPGSPLALSGQPFLQLTDVGRERVAGLDLGLEAVLDALKDGLLPGSVTTPS